MSLTNVMGVVVPSISSSTTFTPSRDTDREDFRNAPGKLATPAPPAPAPAPSVVALVDGSVAAAAELAVKGGREGTAAPGGARDGTKGGGESGGVAAAAAAAAVPA